MNHEKIWEGLGCVGAILVVFGYYLNANLNDSCWIAWIAGNSIVSAYCIYKKAYSTAIMSAVIVIMNIYGLLKW
tara:strand:+ start:204 stop:425 length:222 start_codon:yes stop_codon:yes gene_type:complete